jgi:hypothetical protein
MTDEPRHIAFTKDATKRAALAKVLKTPVLIEALDIVDELMEPQTNTQAEVAPAIAAAKYHQIAGAAEQLKRLKSLTKEPKETKAPKTKTLARTIDDLPQVNL